MTCADVLYIAFREARILKRPQGECSNNELLDGLIFLNQQVDYWSARGCYCWTTNFNVYNLTSMHQPYLIGPTATAPDFPTQSPRPIRIVSANLILDTMSPAVDQPINIRDNQWWAANRVKTISTNIPTDLYYQPDIPNGSIYFWPIANFPYGVRLEILIQLQQFTDLASLVVAPPSYLAGLTLTLAEELVDIWGTEMPLNLARRAETARKALQSNNYLAPRIASADWGTFTSPAADFNYMTGTIPGL